MEGSVEITRQEDQEQAQAQNSGKSLLIPSIFHITLS